MFMLCLHIQDGFRKVKWLKSINNGLKMASNQMGYGILKVCLLAWTVKILSLSWKILINNNLLSRK